MLFRNMTQACLHIALLSKGTELYVYMFERHKNLYRFSQEGRHEYAVTLAHTRRKKTTKDPRPTLLWPNTTASPVLTNRAMVACHSWLRKSCEASCPGLRPEFLPISDVSAARVAGFAEAHEEFAVEGPAAALDGDAILSVDDFRLGAVV